VTTPPAPVVKKKKTLLGLFRGTNDQVPETQAAPAAPAQQIASVPQSAPIQQPAAPTQVASGGSGYFVQLASFKSQDEATAEFGRLKAKHAGIIGTLPSAINPATVGGSTRFRLAVGPLASHDQATKICSSLVAAGERDCLVRKQ
jgi:cell division septation protein DedD